MTCSPPRKNNIFFRHRCVFLTRRLKQEGTYSSLALDLQMLKKPEVSALLGLDRKPVLCAELTTRDNPMPDLIMSPSRKHSKSNSKSVVV